MSSQVYGCEVRNAAAAAAAAAAVVAAAVPSRSILVFPISLDFAPRREVWLGTVRVAWLRRGLLVRSARYRAGAYCLVRRGRGPTHGAIYSLVFDPRNTFLAAGNATLGRHTTCTRCANISYVSSY